MLSPTKELLLRDCIAQLQELVKYNSAFTPISEKLEQVIRIDINGNKELKDHVIASVMHFGREKRKRSCCG